MQHVTRLLAAVALSTVSLSLAERAGAQEAGDTTSAIEAGVRAVRATLATGSAKLGVVTGASLSVVQRDQVARRLSLPLTDLGTVRVCAPDQPRTIGCRLVDTDVFLNVLQFSRSGRQLR